ncbi:hypothetical protein [Micromonospora avicenniae]|uniref:Uncharacterized protein n=1 Tax=Micromonospora avicenniae TaxID=1198245 RepID=A0A1N6TYR8_9ACTN|nr:hypothetical protein [Micromonospora avicenniae]SIQ58513.1 hypothetical protein SAMN05444858_103150 [Micromonospora avicenniae]
MARRGWGGSIATAVGVAAGTGAAQLGFGYGLGIINWAPADAGAARGAWVASLVWATWIAGTSTILGAICAYRLHERALTAGTVTTREPDPTEFGAGSDTATPRPDGSSESARSGAAQFDGQAPTDRRTGDGTGSLRRATLAVAAGLGGLVTVLLVAVPARVAVAPDTGTPQRLAAGYATIGVLMGVLTALWALRSRAAAGNVIATVAWLWLLAVVAVVDGVLAGRGLASAQLGIWQISSDRPEFWIRDYLYWPGAALSLGSALVVGVLAARRPARSAEHRIGAAVSGAAGPLFVAVAYLLAVPRLSAISPEQVSAHLIAPYAVIVGIGGSVLVAALAQGRARRAASRAAAPSTGTASGSERTVETAEQVTEATVPTGARPAGGGGDVTPPGVPAVPYVPAPRTGEADRLDPIEPEGAAAEPVEPAVRPGRRARPPRRAG